ncbi:MAG: HAMP domain-containing protein [Lachnospiraceae bacterium]|nr:HAMP domain-containing protein [Lachnospiraceae bacterium]
MKHSIRKQFAGIFIGLMAASIMLCWFLNSSFLEKYYIINKQTALLNVFGQLQSAVAQDSLSSDATTLYLQHSCAKYNLSLLVVDANSKTVKVLGSDSEFMRQQLLQHVFMQSEGTPQIMLEEDNYVVQRISDARSKMEYIEMWGILDNGNFFLIRSALESIQDSVSIANRFLMYVGLVSILLGGVTIWYVSRKITNPILQLTSISERMTHLDFDVRYNGKSENEIALLGENINKLSETLESTISELKTANNELSRDIEKKNKIDEMRKDFIASVSHELKTPIALIQGYAEGLQEGMADDPETRNFYCDVIMDEATKMNEMVKKLLTLNQLEFGNDVVSMERFDIAALIHNYLQSAELLAKQNEISVQASFDGPVYVWGDEFKTEEVFTNYFSNAVHYCQGQKVIDVRIERCGDVARISVFNTGNPIPEDSLSLIWEKFYKVDKARTREYGGSGVGLSIVKAIMESMHQKYGVMNYENGVAFWFELELVKEES